MTKYLIHVKKLVCSKIFALARAAPFMSFDKKRITNECAFQLIFQLLPVSCFSHTNYTKTNMFQERC